MSDNQFSKLANALHLSMAMCVFAIILGILPITVLAGAALVGLWFYVAVQHFYHHNRKLGVFLLVNLAVFLGAISVWYAATIEMASRFG